MTQFYTRLGVLIRGRDKDGNVMHARIIGKSLARRIREEKEAERLRQWMARTAKGGQQKSD